VIEIYVKHRYFHLDKLFYAYTCSWYLTYRISYYLCVLILLFVGVNTFATCSSLAGMKTEESEYLFDFTFPIVIKCETIAVEVVCVFMCVLLCK
jgi:hypothetical protein